MRAEVQEFLRELAGSEDLAALRAEHERWKDSADLNEAWIAWLRLKAAELLVIGRMHALEDEVCRAQRDRYHSALERVVLAGCCDDCPPAYLIARRALDGN